MDRKTKTDLSPYVVNVQGKDFITFPGLLAEAHAQGLIAIETNLINQDLSNPVVKANVVLADENSPQKVKSFTGYGDANANNVAKKVAGALLRMAETRAVARALRFACNIDMAALEELDAEENVITAKPAANSGPKTFGRTPSKTETTVTVSGPDANGNTNTTVTEIPAVANDTSQVTEKFTTKPKATFGRRATTAKTEPSFP